MCSGSKRKPCQTGLDMEDERGEQEGPHNKISALLEFSAADDLAGLKDAVEREGRDVDEAGLWYGRRAGSRKLGYEERTPLMVAAMFGSLEVLSYVLGTGRADVNRASASDGATALHCAAAGGSAASLKAVRLLLDASADAGAADASGNRPRDLVASNSRKRMLQALLEGGGGQANLALGEEEQDRDAGTPRGPKDYPVDHSLPDIKDGVYGTDEFRMYTFKVKACSRAYSHDWTECPFVHPGENARRRDPRKYHYSCVPCPEFRKGSCGKGDACEYAHGIFECWLHPAQYRTRLCKDEAACARRVCFFAHKPEELRPLYACTGSALPSPRSYSAGAPSFEMGPVSPITLGSSSTPPPPLAPLAGAMWQNQSNVPTLQLPRSRLNAGLTARDIDLEIELLRKQIISSPSGWKGSLGAKPSNLDDIYGPPLDSSISSRFHGISLDAAGPQLHSPTGIQMQPRSYSSGLSSSNVNARMAAFSRRSQSFIERGMASRHSELPLPVSPLAAKPPAFPDWGSPDGRLNWAIQGAELNKLRKSASFGLRSTSPHANVDEPDVSWVNSLVKDPPLESGQLRAENQRQKMQCHPNNGAEAVPAWLEQLYMDQEQMVA